MNRRRLFRLLNEKNELLDTADELLKEALASIQVAIYRGVQKILEGLNVQGGVLQADDFGIRSLLKIQTDVMEIINRS